MNSKAISNIRKVFHKTNEHHCLFVLVVKNYYKLKDSKFLQRAYVSTSPRWYFFITNKKGIDIYITINGENWTVTQKQQYGMLTVYKNEVGFNYEYRSTRNPFPFTHPTTKYIIRCLINDR